MAWTRKKSSLIDRRLEDVQREMSRIQRELKTGSREPAICAKPTTKPPAKPAPATDLFDHAADGGGNPAPATAPQNTPQSARPSHSRSGRERFANYFMAGHFQDLRPSRQEVRVVRTKAILMLTLVLLALFWLFYFFGSH